MRTLDELRAACAQLRQDYEDHMRCGRREEAHRVLARRDHLVLAIREREAKNGTQDAARAR